MARTHLSEPAKAVIADDHAIIRNAVRQILESSGRVEIVGEAEDGISAIAMTKGLSPDLLTLDIAMPNVRGIEVFAEVKRWSPDTKVIVFTGMTSTTLLHELVSAGVNGLFFKRGDPQELARALPRILAGRQVVSNDMRELLEKQSFSDELTLRERQVLGLIVSGASNKEVAKVLGVSHKTVDNHRTNIMRKLDVHSYAELINFAVREGLLEPNREL